MLILIAALHSLPSIRVVTPSLCCRDFSLVDGHCFKALFVGKSNTLNYYQSMNQTNPENVGI